VPEVGTGVIVITCTRVFPWFSGTLVLLLAEIPCDTPAGPCGPGGPCGPTLFQVRVESPVGQATVLPTWSRGTSAVPVL